MKIKLQNQAPALAKNGTTLIEISIYFAVLSILLLALLNFAVQIITVAKISDNSNEMQVSLDILNQKITSTVETADSINNESIFDNDQGVLSLNVPTLVNSPTKIFVSSQDIFIQQGSGNAIKINSDSLKINFFRIHKITANKTPDQITVDAQIAPKYADIANLNKTMELHQTFSLRRL